jgi:hypothetical protein
VFVYARALPYSGDQLFSIVVTHKGSLFTLSNDDANTTAVDGGDDTQDDLEVFPEPPLSEQLTEVDVDKTAAEAAENARGEEKHTAEGSGGSGSGSGTLMAIADWSVATLRAVRQLVAGIRLHQHNNAI